MANQPGETMEKRAEGRKQCALNLCRELAISQDSEVVRVICWALELRERLIERETAQKCAEAVNAERVGETGEELDRVYNMALSHGVKAIGAIYQLKAF